MPSRLSLLALAVWLSACGGGARAFEPASSLDEPTAYTVFDLPEEYEVLDIRYDSGLAGDSLSRTSMLHVLARRRDTGAQALLVYDLRRPRQGPRTVIELQHLASPEAPRR